VNDARRKSQGVRVEVVDLCGISAVENEAVLVGNRVALKNVHADGDDPENDDWNGA